MQDLALLIAQTIVTGGIAAWMVVCVRDNWLFPDINLDAVRMTVTMELLEKDWPDVYAHFAHRRVDDPQLQKQMFRAIVLTETLAAGLLSFATLVLFVSWFGSADPDAARALATVAVSLFTAIWFGFLAGGNYFVYWYCHHSSMTTHNFLILWGIGGLILLQL